MTTRRVRFLFTGESVADPALRGIESGFRNIGTTLRGAQAAFAAFVSSQLIRRLIELQNQLERTGDIADALDISPDFAQTAERAAEDAGGTFEQFADAFGNLQAAIGRGLEADPTVINALNEFGLVFEDLRTLNPEEIFDRVLLAARELDAVTRTQPLRDLFGGDTAARLVAGIAEDTGSLIALQAELRASGQLASASQLEFAERASQASRETRREFANTASEIATGAEQIARDLGLLDIEPTFRGLQGRREERQAERAGATLTTEQNVDVLLQALVDSVRALFTSQERSVQIEQQTLEAIQTRATEGAQF